ncbi:MAG: alkaline phosphatase family protein [Myxococcales bacterium]|nr:alkaline phosphatase family protein [Myxococcales bacterium]MDD9972097.1 alkaline phosphatase family protein [Myxococcales bacterium]
MSARHLAIGLDGADLALLESLGPSTLPNLHALMHRGSYAALQSVQPPATLPNWTTFLTGENPGRHGVFDFTTRSGYSVRFTAGSVRQSPTIAARLDRLGKTCACLFFPATYPPEQLDRGVFISGWDAPVAFEADPTFVWPRTLHADITRRFGPMRFDDVDEFDSDRPGFHDQLADRLKQRIERRIRICQWLLQVRTWDLFAVYFGESDTAAHHLWALHDPNSPRRPAHVSSAQESGLRRVYQALDRAVGQLVASAGGRSVEVTIASDHGFGGASDKVVYLNRALSEAGLLAFHPSGSLVRALGRKAVQHAKETALTRFPQRLREQLFRASGAKLPSALESQARYGAIDMQRTQAFSDELNYFPAVHLNVRGREPEGIVDPSDVAKVTEAVRTALLSLRDPWTGMPVVSKVMRREDIYRGPCTNQAPDLVLELALDGGYSYNLMPSWNAPKGSGAFRQLSSDEFLGRKGRSLQGSHRSRGLWIAAGPQVRSSGQVDLTIADATATLLARMGASLPEHADGQVCSEVLTIPTREESRPPVPLPNVETLHDERSQPMQDSEQARVAERLRRLGYIE